MSRKSSSLKSSNSSQDHLLIAYDGDCPFCAAYVRMSRIQALDLSVQLINLRDDPALCEDLKQRGMHPDQGMYVRLGDVEYHGAQAMNVLSSFSTSRFWANRVFQWVFKNATRARVIYPFLRFGRFVTLRLLGRSSL